MTRFRYPLIGVRRLSALAEDGRVIGSHVDPPFRRRWSRLRQLRWHAEVVEVDSGITPGSIRVEKGRAFTNGIFQYGLFSISSPGMGISPMPFHACWDYLNGIRDGIAILERQRNREAADLAFEGMTFDLRREQT